MIFILIQIQSTNFLGRVPCFSCSGNHEAEGTCFLQSPSSSQLRARLKHVRGLPEGDGVSVNSPTLCHPRFLLPDEPWLARPYCLSSVDKYWKFDGTFQASFILLPCFLYLILSFKVKFTPKSTLFCL